MTRQRYALISDTENEELTSMEQRITGHNLAKDRIPLTTTHQGSQYADLNNQHPTIKSTAKSSSRSRKRKYRERSVAKNVFKKAKSAFSGHEGFAGNHNSGDSFTEHRSYDKCSSSSPSPPPSLPFPATVKAKHSNWKRSLYGMFPPPPRPSTLPAQTAQVTSETQHHSDKMHSTVKSESRSLERSMPDSSDDRNAPFESDGNCHSNIHGHKDNHSDDNNNHDGNYNNQNDNDSGGGNDSADSDGDEHIFNAKIVAAEAELNLARLRVEAAESAARKAKKKRKSAMSRRSSGSIS